MTDRQMMMLIGAGAVLLLVLRREAVNAAATVGHAIAPTNPDNIFSEAVDAVGRSISGQEHWTLGGWVYDLLHPTSEAQRHYDDQLTGAGFPTGGFFINASGPYRPDSQNTWVW